MGPRTGLEECQFYGVLIYKRRTVLKPVVLWIFMLEVMLNSGYIYTGCPRRNVPDFGRVFLMLKYTDITQNTYAKVERLRR